MVQNIENCHSRAIFIDNLFFYMNDLQHPIWFMNQLSRIHRYTRYHRAQAALASSPSKSLLQQKSQSQMTTGVAFINGAPQNTFVPGLIEFATKKNVMIGGDDFKSGQTKMKSVLVDFLVGAGIKPTSIVSYNHLGNNDGMNLSAPQTFRSKEISKSNVVDDMVASNSILYAPGESPKIVMTSSNASSASLYLVHTPASVTLF